jgi:hypothetical protein
MFKDIETLRETIRKFKLQRLEKKIVSKLASGRLKTRRLGSAAPQ